MVFGSVRTHAPAPLLLASLLAAAGCGAAGASLARFVAAHPLPERVDVAVVFGCNSTAEGGVSPCLVRRVDHAVALWRAGRARRLLFTGGRTLPVWASEARLMGERARAAGVPAAAVIEEGRAQTTFDNLVLSVPLLRAAGARSVGLVSHARHLGRIAHLALANDLDREFALSFETVP